MSHGRRRSFDVSLSVVAFLAASVMVGASRCTSAVRPDSSPVSALEANDATVILEVTGPGCSGAPSVGYAYCRKREGDVAGESVVVHVPAAKCKTKPCVVVRFFFPGGDPTLERAVPDSQTRLTVPWKDLLKATHFDRSHIGYWPVILDWRWLDSDGNEGFSRAHGEIRLRVYQAAYSPLHEADDSPDFAWRWTDTGYFYAMSTAGRATVRADDSP